MKYLQLLTLVSATVPHCTTALVLNSGISQYPPGARNSTTTSSNSTATSIGATISTSSGNGIPILPTTRPVVPAGSTLPTAISPTIAATAPVETGANSASSSITSPSNGAPTFPPGPGHQRLYSTRSAFSSGAGIFPTRPNHKPSAISSGPIIPSTDHILYHGLNRAHQNSVVPNATTTAGNTGSSNGVFPPSGTGQVGGGTGAPKGIFPPGATSQIGVGSTGIPKGIFPPSGTGAQITASGTSAYNASLKALQASRSASCGPCYVIIPAVQIEYFPVSSENNATCTPGSTPAGPAITPPPAPALLKRRLNPRNASLESIAIEDGQTLTAPSMYVAMTQGIHITDSCGPLGTSLAQATVPVASGAISTLSFPLTSGQTLSTAMGSIPTYTKPLRVEDLACPTWGISGNWNSRPDADPLDMPGGGELNVPSAAAAGATTLAIIQVVQDDTHVGAPWYPIIVLPHEVLQLDPMWESCEGRLVNPAFPIFDPPRPLTAETLLVSQPASPVVAQAQTTANPGNNDAAKSTAAALVPTSAALAPAPAASPGVVNSAAASSDPSAPAPVVPASVAPAANPPASSPAAQSPAFIQSLSAALAVSTVSVVPIPAATSPAANPPAESPAAAPAPAPLSVAGQQVQQQGSTLVVGGQSIAPGSTASIAGHQVVNNVKNGNNVVVDGSSQAIVATPAPAPAPAPLPSVAGQPVQQQGSTLVVAGQSIAPGSTGSVAGHQVVNHGDAVVVDGSSQAIPAATPAPVLVAPAADPGASSAGVAPAFQGEGGNGLSNSPAAAAAPLPSVGGQPIQQQGSNLVVAGSTIAPGASASVAGHQVVNNVNNGNAVVVDGSSQALPAAGVTPAPVASPVITVGGSAYTAGPSSNFVINGQTLNPSSPITVSGTPISLLPGNTAVAIGSSTQAIATPAPVASPVITVGGSAYTAGPSSNFVINGQTLNPSNPITVSGTPISLLPGNTAVAIGSSTQAITTPPPNANPPAQGQPALTIDGSTYYPTGPSSAYVLPGGQTLTPGAQVTVGNTPVSLASDGSVAVVGSSTENLAPTITAAPGEPALTFAGSTYHPIGTSSQYVIGGQTLAAGAPPITVSGVVMSLASNGATAVVGTSTENLQPPITAQPALTFDGTTYSPTNVAGASSAYIIDGQTLTPGAGPITVSGTPISLASNGATAVVGSITQDLEPSITPEPALTFDGSTYHPITGASSDFVIDGQTLVPGGSPITVSGTPISLAPGAASAVIGTSTQNLQMSEPPLTFDGSTYLPTGPLSAYVIGGQTITPGALVTVSGTPISLASNGASAVVGSSTEDLLPSLTSGAALTVGGQTFTPNPSSFIVGGKTMTVGGSAIISGTPVVLEPSGTLMVGTSEIPLASASAKISASQPLAGGVARRSVPWLSLTVTFVGTGFLYIS